MTHCQLNYALRLLIRHRYQKTTQTFFRAHVDLYACPSPMLHWILWICMNWLTVNNLIRSLHILQCITTLICAECKAMETIDQSLMQYTTLPVCYMESQFLLEKENDFWFTCNEDRYITNKTVWDKLKSHDFFQR